MAKKRSDFGTSANLKIEKLPVTLATWSYQEFFINKFDSKSSWFEIKIVFLKGFIIKEPRGGGKNALSMEKQV